MHGGTLLSRNTGIAKLREFNTLVQLCNACQPPLQSAELLQIRITGSQCTAVGKQNGKKCGGFKEATQHAVALQVMRQFLKLRKTAGSLFVEAEELEKARPQCSCSGWLCFVQALL